jgi:TonB family protein
LLSRNAPCISWVLIAHGLLIFAILSAHPPKEGDAFPESILADLRSSTPRTAPAKANLATKDLANSQQTGSNAEARSQKEVMGSMDGGLSVGGVGIRQKISGPKPHYPLMSRRLREEGEVLLKLCLNSLGSVQTLHVLRSSGYKNLDDSALKALSAWKFNLAANAFNDEERDCFRMPVQFRLES